MNNQTTTRMKADTKTFKVMFYVMYAPTGEVIDEPTSKLFRAENFAEATKMGIGEIEETMAGIGIFRQLEATDLVMVLQTQLLTDDENATDK